MNDNFKYLFLLHFIKKIKFKIKNIFIIKLSDLKI